MCIVFTNDRGAVPEAGGPFFAVDGSSWVMLFQVMFLEMHSLESKATEQELCPADRSLAAYEISIASWKRGGIWSWIAGGSKHHLNEAL